MGVRFGYFAPGLGMRLGTGKLESNKCGLLLTRKSGIQRGFRGWG